MQLSDTIATLLRRWYVLLLGLCLTAAGGWYAYRSIPTTYEATGSLLLMPSTDTVGAEGNPYLYLNGMIDARDVLLRRAGSTENYTSVVAEHPGTAYTLGSDPTTQSPIVTVAVEGATPEDALAVMHGALENVEENLDAMQDEVGLPDGQRLGASPLVLADSATASRTAAARLAIVVLGAGGLGTLLVAGLVDGALMRRRERRSAEIEPAATDRAVGDGPPVEPLNAVTDPQAAGAAETGPAHDGTTAPGEAAADVRPDVTEAATDDDAAARGTTTEAQDEPADDAVPRETELATASAGPPDR
ncbi:hypothetical protein ACPYO6_10165 [Georgenia sp. Z1344]|uniref:hypothetical protein n=1 Tax=Georgenia sp. Z1344 TaxID=3416706 RepID=UPI003CF7B37E